MTEDEAKTKWCPFARRMPHLFNQMNVAGNVGYSLNGPPVDREALCIGSACMAWRWDVGISDADWEKREHSKTHGFCGLAGAVQ